jgi:glutamyl-Q tRNA(Asp) synthetase
MTMPSAYVGRFAPSPSGPLHFGSLVCALASYLHARQHNGRWLVRIEDIDTPRVDSKMSPVILNSLLAHGMQWDGEVIYQSECHQRYNKNLDYLAQTQQIYGCRCSRREINQRAAYYDRLCRDANLSFDRHALRWKNDAGIDTFEDLHMGTCRVEERLAKEDPVLKRADGIFAYHLAVVSDDIAQNVSHIVRGADLIDTTPLHMSLFKALGGNPPAYFHIPVACDVPSQKLSKQHHAPAIDDSKALSNLKSALVFFGASAAEIKHLQSVDSLLQWAINHWQVSRLSTQTEILVEAVDGVYALKQ